MLLAYANGYIVCLHTDRHRFPGGNRHTHRHRNAHSFADANENSFYHHAVPDPRADRFRP